VLRAVEVGVVDAVVLDMSETRSVTGSCLCGGVRYRLTGELRDVVNCFCQQCQKTSGHHVAATRVLNSGFELLSDKTLSWYRSSDFAERGFCTIDSERISVMAGTIDHPTGLTTKDNIFTEDKSDYHTLPEVTKAH